MYGRISLTNHPMFQLINSYLQGAFSMLILSVLVVMVAGYPHNLEYTEGICVVSMAIY